MLFREFTIVLFKQFLCRTSTLCLFTEFYIENITTKYTMYCNFYRDHILWFLFNYANKQLLCSYCVLCRRSNFDLKMNKMCNLTRDKQTLANFVATSMKTHKNLFCFSVPLWQKTACNRLNLLFWNETFVSIHPVTWS